MVEVSVEEAADNVCRVLNQFLEETTEEQMDDKLAYKVDFAWVLAFQQAVGEWTRAKLGRMVDG